MPNRKVNQSRACNTLLLKVHGCWLFVCRARETDNPKHKTLLPVYAFPRTRNLLVTLGNYRSRNTRTRTNNYLAWPWRRSFLGWSGEASNQKKRSSPSLCQGKINLHVQVENSFCVGGWLRPSNKKMFSRTCNTGRGSVGRKRSSAPSFLHFLPGNNMS